MVKSKKTKEKKVKKGTDPRKRLKKMFHVFTNELSSKTEMETSLNRIGQQGKHLLKSPITRKEDERPTAYIATIQQLKGVNSQIDMEARVLSLVEILKEPWHEAMTESARNTTSKVVRSKKFLPRLANLKVKRIKAKRTRKRTDHQKCPFASFMSNREQQKGIGKNAFQFGPVVGSEPSTN